MISQGKVGGLLEHLPSLSQMKVVKGALDSNRDTERVRPGGRIRFGPNRIG